MGFEAQEQDKHFLEKLHSNPIGTCLKFGIQYAKAGTCLLKRKNGSTKTKKLKKSTLMDAGLGWPARNIGSSKKNTQNSAKSKKDGTLDDHLA